MASKKQKNNWTGLVDIGDYYTGWANENEINPISQNLSVLEKNFARTSVDFYFERVTF